jgi:thioredoxin 1
MPNLRHTPKMGALRRNPVPPGGPNLHAPGSGPGVTVLNPRAGMAETSSLHPLLLTMAAGVHSIQRLPAATDKEWPMASDNVLELTDDNFQEKVLDSDQPALVDFWAEWCMPCKMLAPAVEELADEYAGKVTVGKVDTDNNREISLKFGINAIPTVMIFKGGEVVQKFVGLQQKADLKAALDGVVG